MPLWGSSLFKLGQVYDAWKYDNRFKAWNVDLINQLLAVVKRLWNKAIGFKRIPVSKKKLTEVCLLTWHLFLQVNASLHVVNTTMKPQNPLTLQKLRFTFHNSVQINLPFWTPREHFFFSFPLLVFFWVTQTHVFFTHIQKIPSFVIFSNWKIQSDVIFTLTFCWVKSK